MGDRAPLQQPSNASRSTTAGARSSRQPHEEHLAPGHADHRRAASSRSSPATIRPTSRFDLSINPYRGCEHGCIYCFARPTHSYLNMSPGLDFETRIIAKVNAAERLRETFAQAELRAAGAQRRLGHRCLPAGRAQARHHALDHRGAGRMPASVLAGHQVVGHRARPRSDRADGGRGPGGDLRLDHLARSAARAHRWSRAPRRRTAGCKTIEALAEAGVPVGVSVSPIIPFINRPDIERILEAAREAGATRGVRASCCGCRGR